MSSLKVSWANAHDRSLLPFALIAVLFIQFLSPVSAVLAQPTKPTDPLAPRGAEQPGALTAAQERVIIRLNPAPLAGQGFDSRLQHAQIAGQQAGLLNAMRSAGIPVSLHRQFKGLLFNGIALTVSSADIPRIKQLRDVAEIYPDQLVHMNLSESVPLVGAPAAWGLTGADGLSVEGQGMTVAILDSGIDYTHPDLGSGLGPGFKVKGGFDYVNNDTDPMDDDGHGTHVAGIVAANGTLKGVAPQAQLLAYKVLDAHGNGLTSNIIAALEQALNPDGDAATDDGADVINLSLGTPGSPADPLSQAVDQAVSLGAVVVVAAGNNGNAYATVDSPGIAEKAITVAATDDLDHLADFSARGPVAHHPEIIKPDLAAPGVNILSTVPASGESGSPSRYNSLSGTSMAAPHVAGAAALIRQLHPTWTPEQVKASLITTAKPLNYGPYEVGAGRLRVDQAAQAPLLITPSSVGAALALPGQTAADALINLYNPGKDPVAAAILPSASLALDLNFQAVLPAQVDYLKVDESSVSLKPGESAQVHLRINVPAGAQDGYYTGQVQFSIGSQVLRVPVAFSVKTHPDLSNQPAGVVGQIGGGIRAIASQGFYVFLGHGPRLEVLDVSNPGAPVVVGQSEILPGVVVDIEVAGSYAYIAADQGGFVILDISNKADPKWVGAFSTSDRYQAVDALDISGGYAFLTDYWRGLRIVDISSPASPRQVGFFSQRQVNSVSVSGNYAYLASGADLSYELQVIDIRSKTTPVQVGSVSTVNEVTQVGLKDHYAYLMGPVGGLRVVDIADPAHPVVVGGYDIDWRASNLLIQGNSVYISNWRLGLLIFDITQPTQPTLTTDYSIPGYTYDIALIGSYAFVACDLIGLCVEDLSNPVAPSPITAKQLDLPSEVYGVALGSGYAQVGNSWNNLAVIDATYPDDPLNVATYTFMKFGSYAGTTQNLAVDGGYTFLANQDGLGILDTSAPGQPKAAGYLEIEGYPHDVAVLGNYAYVADLNYGLRTVDVTDKAHPVLVNSYPLDKMPYTVAAGGDYVYVGLMDGSRDLIIFDIHNPAEPINVGAISMEGVTDVMVSGNTLYVLGITEGLEIYDVSNPSFPFFRAIIKPINEPVCVGMALHDQTIYIAMNTEGLAVVDVSDPSKPGVTAIYDTPGGAEQVASDGDYAYVSDGWGGLVVVKLFSPPPVLMYLPALSNASR